MTAGSLSPTPAADDQAAAHHPQKRRRIGYACDLCRLKKNRCDGDRPSCGPCKERRQECVYSPQRSRVSVTQEYVDDLKLRNQMLEKQLATLHKTNGQNYRNSLYGETSTQQGQTGNGIYDATAAHQYMSPPQLPPGAPHSVNQQQLGQSPAERQTVSSEATNSLKEATDGTPTEYFGESSAFDFMAKVGSPENDTSKGAPAARGQRPTLRERNASLAASSPSAPIFDGLLLGGGADDPFGLPHRFVADRLVDAYFKYRHPLNSYLHEETFRHRYRRLWLSQDVGGEEATQQNLAWFGLVNLVFAFGSDHAPVSGRSSNDRSRYFKRAKTLVFSGLLQAGSLELVQALLLMGQYLHGSLELNNCWTVVGLAIRTAQGLGLHLDAGNFTSDIIEQEVRKRVWWGCFVIDRVLSMKVGRPPTIHDGPAIKVGLPLSVDDEFLSAEEGRSIQPPGTPSKLEYFNQIIPQCRLMERILDTLYSGGSTGGTSESLKQRAVIDTPKLLALSIQLDGELVAWREALPSHLKPGSQNLEWHFERQRNVLMMRFLHARHLVHRQTLLLYITRRVTDEFQREIMHSCVKRCVTAAHDSITQMKLLHQQNLLSSFWHNSHYVFSALGVLLVYQTIDSQSKAEVGLYPGIDVDQTISQGLELLQRVGGQMHPLASRYVQSFQQLQSRLRAISSSSNRGQSSKDASESRQMSAEQSANVSTVEAQGGSEYHYQQQTYLYPGGMQDMYRPTMGEVSLMAGFEDEFANIENMLLDSTGWTGLMDDWNQV